MIHMNKIRILNIFPDIMNDNIAYEVSRRHDMAKKLFEDTNGLVELETRTIPGGSVSIETAYDAALATPYVLQVCKDAETEGFDAVCIDCFCDPGFVACRQLASIPVVSAGHSACHLAVRMGGYFSVLGLLEDMEYDTRSALSQYGLLDHLASIRNIETPVSLLWSDPDTLINNLVEVALKAVREDSAKILVLGCTGMSQVVQPVRDKLCQMGVNVPIVEAWPAALYDAIACAMQGISHSKLAYPNVRDKIRNVDFAY